MKTGPVGVQRNPQLLIMSLYIMKRKFKQWWSAIPPISTKWTFTARLKSLNTKKLWHLPIDVQVLARDRYNKLTVIIMTRIVFGIFSLPYPETFKFDKIQISTCSVYSCFITWCKNNCTSKCPINAVKIRPQSSGRLFKVDLKPGQDLYVGLWSLNVRILFELDVFILIKIRNSWNWQNKYIYIYRRKICGTISLDEILLL